MGKMTFVGKKVSIAAIVGGICAAVFASTASAGPTIYVGKEGSMTITYGLQAWYRNTDYSAPNQPSASDFYDRRDRLSFSGQVNDFVGYFVQLEGGGNPGTSHNVFVRDSYVTFDYRDDLRFIVGKFKNTFTRENLEDCLGPLTLDRSTLLAYTPWGGTRDNGVAVWGNLDNAKFQYRFMIAQGRDSSAQPAHKPRYTVRVQYSPWDPEYGYGYEGTYLGTRKVLTFGAAYDTQKDVVYANYPMRADPKNYKAWTVDAFMEYPAKSGVYTLSGAYMDYSTGGAINDNPDPAFPVNADLKGYYVKGGYMLPGKLGPGRLQFFARHEKANYGIKVGNANYYDQTWNSVGANYYLNGQNLKLTAAYAHIKFDTPDPAAYQLQNYTMVTAGLQFIF